MKERGIEAYLVKRVKELGGEVRKVEWAGRRGAPDRVVMLPNLSFGGHRYAYPSTVWVELKNPETIKTFPANAHERQQHREHERMRKVGQIVLVLGTKEAIDEWLGPV
jgi:hypothetical protein